MILESDISKLQDVIVRFQSLLEQHGAVKGDTGEPGIPGLTGGFLDLRVQLDHLEDRFRKEKRETRVELRCTR